MEILKYLDRFKFITSYEVLDYKSWEQGSYSRLKITLSNGSHLFTKEYISEAERIYSFHWQDKFDNLLTRWDNAPHHKDIATFPHHKHENEKLCASNEITLEDVLAAIALQLGSE
ncbi:MAG: hypothetical protein GF401_17240 [Chitinivibrionales bacterium]|nr:hypothetical protein [Chitinivibrionales bacterium]